MSTIKSSTTSTTAFSVVADTTGTLVFQTGATPTTAMTLGSDQSVTFAGTPTYSGGTANGVAYLNGSKALTTGSALVFTGTKLTAAGDISATVTGTGNVGIEIARTGGTTASWYNYVPSGSADLRWFKGADLMTLDASGNLLVNTNATGYKFNVVAGASYCASFACNSGNVPLTCAITSGSGSQTYTYFYNGATLTGTITTTGTNTAYNSISDYRLKENIAPMTGALDVVKQLKPVTYKWKTDGTDGQGFIAHELQTVVPECVTGEKDAVDEEGNPNYQAIDTSFLVATLTAAIQELNAKFEEYKAAHP